MTLDILKEASQLSEALNAAKIDWAFVGGIAVGIYGFIRATEDIDIIVKEHDLQEIDRILEKNGFVINESPLVFQDGFKCFRRLKFDNNDSFFILDILVHPEFSETYLRNKIEGGISSTKSFVISKKDLIEMKLKANRPKDRIDIESLNDE